MTADITPPAKGSRDWDPIRCSHKGEDLSLILPPAALRLFESEVAEIRAKQRLRQERERFERSVEK